MNIDRARRRLPRDLVRVYEASSIHKISRLPVAEAAKPRDGPLPRGISAPLGSRVVLGVAFETVQFMAKLVHAKCY